MLREDFSFFLPGEGGGFTRELLLRFLLYIAFLTFAIRIVLLGVTVYQTRHYNRTPPSLPGLPALPNNAPQPLPDHAPGSSQPVDNI